MPQDRLKMLVFVRPSFFPLTLAFCSSVHYIASPFHLIQLHKYLECLDVSLASMLDTHPLAFLSLSFYSRLLRLDVGALESRSRRSRCLLLHRDPRWPGIVWRFPGGGFAFSIELLLFVLAFLRKTCIFVSVLRYYCFR